MDIKVVSDIMANFGFWIIVPWCAWVTTSVYTQRQELALTKQILENLIKSTIRN